jgi:hypothetical protein
MLLWSVPSAVILMNVIIAAKTRQIYLRIIPYLDNPEDFKLLSESTKRSLASYD